MIRLKQSMGNTIKCKIDTEVMISKYECSALEANRLNGLMNIQIDKSSTIVYSDEVKKNLAEVLAGNIGEATINDYLCQIARVILEVKKIGLNPEKLILNPEWVYLTKDEKVLKFIYYPVNGMCGRYDGILFMKDILLKVSLVKDVRDRWNQWLEEVNRTGITEQAVFRIEKGIYGGGNGSDSDYDNGEVKTGHDSENVWHFRHQEVEEEPVSDAWIGEEDDDGEAPTGFEDIDEEAPTGNEDDEGYSSTILSENFSHKPSLIRVNTGEKIVITSDDFKLGRSEQRADFCIRNNGGISNVHATVMKRNSQYFLKDNYSKNGTYVDGKQITDSNIPVLLRDGSVIQLYNEEIVFKY